MEKTKIKTRVKESLNELFSMEKAKIKETPDKHKESPHGKDIKHKNDNSRNQGEGGKKDYADVRRAFEKLGGPSMVDAMKLTGISDDEKGTNRSLFRKKVKQIKNKDTGSYYQFSDEELNRVRAALDIQN